MGSLCGILVTRPAMPAITGTKKATCASEP